jgi:quinolinate synthase
MPNPTYGAASQSQPIDQNGNALHATTNGQVVTAVNAITVIKASAGRIFKIVVTTSTAQAVTLFDNASAASGQILFVVPASAALGTIYDLSPGGGIPFVNGLTASASATNPGLNVSIA